jgi:hypothetical protein
LNRLDCRRLGDHLGRHNEGAMSDPIELNRTLRDAQAAAHGEDELEFPYGGAEPQLFEESGSYAVPDAVLEPAMTVQFAHSLGEVVTAAVDAGLTIRGLEEHLDADRDPRGIGADLEPDGRYRLRSGRHPLPMMFTLIAQKVAGEPVDEQAD